MEPKQRWTYYEDLLTNGFSNTILLEIPKYANFDLGSRLLSPDLPPFAEFMQRKQWTPWCIGFAVESYLCPS